MPIYGTYLRCEIKLIEHHIDLAGPSCEGRYARPDVVGRVLSSIGPMAMQTIRMCVLHTSRKVGRPVKGLARSWDIRHGGQKESPDGGTRLLFRAPTLHEAAPELFNQGKLWDEGPNPEDTAFDLIGAVVADIREQKRDSERYDTDLLGRVAGFDKALSHGLDRLSIGGHQLDARSAPVIDSSLTAIAKSWIASTPEPKRVRVCGKLDMIRVSDRVFELVLDDENRVRAVWTDSAVLHLRKHLDQVVLIEGQAVFRPSGSLLRVDAEVITTAKHHDSLFSTIPTASMSTRLGQLRVPQTENSGVNAIWGKWAADESETDLLNALEAMS